MASSSIISLKFSSTTKFPVTQTKTKSFALCRRIYSRKKSFEPNNDNQSYSRRNRVVDENLIILGKRIHEMKMIERNYEPPEEWMDWEKRYYATYDSYICEALGFLQAQLMNTRPSLAIGLVTLITFSVPTSTVLVLSHFMDFIGSCLARIQM